MADALLLLSQFNSESSSPNIFLLIAARYLSRLMADLFKLGHVSLCSHYPRLAPTAEWSSELFLLAALGIEGSSLKSSDCGFTEGFFGLKRESLHAKALAGGPSSLADGPRPVERAVSLVRRALVPRPRGAEGTRHAAAVVAAPLTTGHRLCSLAELVLLPWVEGRLQEHYAYYTSDQPDVLLERRAAMAYRKAVLEGRGAVARRLTTRLVLIYIRLLVRYYPAFRTMTRLVELALLMGYAVGRTCYFNPIQYMGSVRLRRVTMLDRADASQQAPSTTQRVAALAGLGLSGVFVALRVLEWSRRGNRAGADEPVLQGSEEGGGDIGPNAVPFPLASKVAAKGAATGQCIVCKKGLVNPAVNIVSGAVGCYVCLQEFLTAHAKCPMTGVKSAPHHIRRLYEG